MSKAPQSLRASAQRSVTLGAGATMLQDIVQFGSMLILARLLTPEIYGQFALAIALTTLVSSVLYKPTAGYPMQARDPHTFVWNVHRRVALTSAGLVGLVLLALGSGLVLIGEPYATTGRLVMILALGAMVDVYADRYLVFLQSMHLWGRFRALVLANTLCASVVAITLAAMSPNAYALALSAVLATAPSAVAALIVRPLRGLPDGALSAYRQGFRFAFVRAGSNVLMGGKPVLENFALSALFGLATVGLYNRALGLANLAAGRVGPLLFGTLYPVLTRAEAGSERFKRNVGLLLRGVVWVVVPVATFTAIEARPLVSVLYGDNWLGVIPMIPFVVAIVAFSSLTLSIYKAILANERPRTCLILDAVLLASVVVAFALAGWFSLPVLLAALLAQSVFMFLLTAVVAHRQSAIDGRSLAATSTAAAVAALAGAFALALLPASPDGPIAATIAVSVLRGAVFAFIYLAGLRLVAARPLAEFLDVAPGGHMVARVLRCPAAQNARGRNMAP